MNFAALIDELQARGFDALDDTRAGRYINQGRAELDMMELWSYRESSATGTAPLAISDLGTIEAVMVTSDSNRLLSPATWGWLLATYGDVSEDGDPEWYYTANPSGTPQVATYPESSETIGVQYFQITPELTGTDTPLAPERYHGLYVDLAARRAYRDMHRHSEAEALQAQIERDVHQMRMDLLNWQVQGPELMQITYGSLDW